jgi:hypothetical protein
MPLARQDDDGDEPLIPLAWRLTVPACNFFNVHDGQDLADSEGTELADRDEAHRQAFIMAGEMLKSADKTFLQDDVGKCASPMTPAKQCVGSSSRRRIATSPGRPLDQPAGRLSRLQAAGGDAAARTLSVDAGHANATENGLTPHVLKRLRRHRLSLRVETGSE